EELGGIPRADRRACAAVAIPRVQLLSVAAGELGRQRNPRERRNKACLLASATARWGGAQTLEEVRQHLEVLAQERSALGVLGETEGALDRGDDERGDLARVDVAVDGALSPSPLERLGEGFDPRLENDGDAAAEALVERGHLLREVVERTAQLDLVDEALVAELIGDDLEH